jgi:hypothetical protein
MYVVRQLKVKLITYGYELLVTDASKANKQYTQMFSYSVLWVQRGCGGNSYILLGEMPCSLEAKYQNFTTSQFMTGVTSLQQL